MAPISKRTFHKTSFTLEILSEEPFTKDFTLEEIACALAGDAFCKATLTARAELTAPIMATTLIAWRHDPDDVFLTAKGEDREDTRKPEEEDYNVN